MYHTPDRAPKGTWAVHIHEQRRKRGLSQTQAFNLVRERLHLSPSSRATYIALDMGDRQPRQEEAEVLAAEFGWPPEPTPAPLETTESRGSVAEAIDRQTAALKEMAAAIRDRDAPLELLLRGLIEVQAAQSEHILSLEKVVQRLFERGNPTSPGLPVRPETAV